MISLVVVNYRSAALAIEAVRTARASTSRKLQVIVVDNSNEAEALRNVADELLVSATNRGYAGAINDARRVAKGDVLVVCNPDVTFSPGSIDALVDALDERTAVAGPALFWDDAHEWLLPPSDLHTGWERLDEVLASRSRAWFEERDRRRFRARVTFWSLRETTQVRALSGAVMAIRAGDFDHIGGFDERFRLYFEETDFLRRLRKRIVYVPSSRVRHLYNQSAGQVASDAAARYAESELRYLEKWNGPFAARFLRRIARPLPSFDANDLEGELELERDDVVVEASPLASFTTAAGHFPRGRSVALPPEVWTSLRNGSLFLRVVDRRTAKVLATFRRYRT